MCDYSGKLIAWLDRELPDDKASGVEQHVAQCAECKHAVNVYQEISGAFLDCYERAMIAQPKRVSRSRALLLSGLAASAAAAILLAVLTVRPRPVQSPMPPAAVHAPAIAYEKTPLRLAVVEKPVVSQRKLMRISAAHVRPTPAPMPIRSRWVTPVSAAGPTVEVALPAEDLFPPGAVPRGFTFIADVRPQP